MPQTLIDQIREFADTRLGQTLFMLGGIVSVWGTLLWAKWRFERRLSRHGAFVLRHLSAPIQLGFFVFSVSVASQILPKEIARHPYMRYGLRIALILALFWMLDRLLSVLLRRSAIAAGGGGRQDLSRTPHLGAPASVLAHRVGTWTVRAELAVAPAAATVGADPALNSLKTEDQVRSLNHFQDPVYHFPRRWGQRRPVRVRSC